MPADDYITPRSAWAMIAPYLPKDKVIWEPFYCDGASGRHLTSLGFRVHHQPNEDFFLTPPQGDLVVSNPPYSKTEAVLERLIALQLPFVLIMPVSKLSYQYVQRLLRPLDPHIQIALPPKRFHFQDPTRPEGWRSECPFECYFYCWRIGLPSDLMFLSQS